MGNRRYAGKPRPAAGTARITALVAGSSGEIFELEGYAAVGADGPLHTPLTVAQTVAMPFGSELMYLPDRRPVLYNLATRRMETLHENPYAPGEPLFPVAVFNSPGYVLTHTCAFAEMEDPVALPLFSYGAVGWHRGKFRSACIQVDRERRQDLRLMPRHKVIAGIHTQRKRLPDNRLRAHLEKCALEYGCPAGKNFFLGRFEAPLPTSRACNARCLGCLSLQGEKSDIPCSQNRIDFTPSPDEIAAVALEHIGRVKQSVVSFGQGCEGDPLLAADVIEPAIRKIRQATAEGTINMNTNASRPDILERLFGAGLDSIRVSINSVREVCYTAYFRPREYRFPDVLESIDLAGRSHKFVALNYLNCPGITDSPEEADALCDFLRSHPVHLIQWRNLNFDPIRYRDIMNRATRHSDPVGMASLLQRVRREFPALRHGYFNPPREKWGAALKGNDTQPEQTL